MNTSPNTARILPKIACLVRSEDRPLSVGWLRPDSRVVVTADRPHHVAIEPGVYYTVYTSEGGWRLHPAEALQPPVLAAFVQELGSKATPAELKALKAKMATAEAWWEDRSITALEIS